MAALSKCATPHFAHLLLKGMLLLLEVWLTRGMSLSLQVTFHCLPRPALAERMEIARLLIVGAVSCLMPCILLTTAVHLLGCLAGLCRPQGCKCSCKGRFLIEALFIFFLEMMP